jgi:hypothetical protein
VAKGEWRPRQGAKLPTGWDAPSRLQGKVRSMLAKIPKRLLHPVWGILIATALAVTGRSELALHSYGLLAAIMWLILDLWVWLLEKRPNWHWRFAIGVGLSSALLIFVLAVVWWWLDGKLQDQRENVFQHLEFSHYLASSDENNPMNTIFTVTNGGGYQISRNNLIGCEVILAVGDQGASFVQNIGRPAYANPDNGHIEISRTGEHPQFVGSLLNRGDDAESAKCLSWFGFQHGAQCLDVRIVFWYSLESQPDREQEKKVRYVAGKGNDGKFSWLPQPADSPQSYCIGFYKGHTGISFAR